MSTQPPAPKPELHPFEVHWYEEHLRMKVVVWAESEEAAQAVWEAGGYNPAKVEEDERQEAQYIGAWPAEDFEEEEAEAEGAGA